MSYAAVGLDVEATPCKVYAKGGMYTRGCVVMRPATALCFPDKTAGWSELSDMDAVDLNERAVQPRCGEDSGSKWLIAGAVVLGVAWMFTRR